MKKVLNTIIGFFTFMVIGFIILGGTKLVVNAAVIDAKTISNIEYVFDTISNNTNDLMSEYKNEFNAARDKFADEVNKYIKRIAPTSKVDPYILIDLCTKYNIDVAFVLAQGQIESHYATAGTAKRTKSIFNVGAYDGYSAAKQCKNGFGFSNPNDSIEPYLILLTKNYLVNGKTINDLMNRYVNKFGMRYASNPSYESQLRSVYNKIYRNTNFKIAYEEYKNCYNKIY